MKYIFKFNFLFLSALVLLGFNSCVDDKLNPDISEFQLPDEFRNGYSISFQISLDPMGGNEYSSRATGDKIREIENFIDLERLRILFFTCEEEEKDQYYESGNKGPYESGAHDVFLFESKSRWVSEIGTTSANGSKVWQVTAPVFTYGNDDEYDWERIRKALTTKHFKIAILANRPGSMRFGDFDNQVHSGEEFYFGNGGPYWGPEESFDPKVTINDLHHCQWDPVYTSKNLIKGVSSKTSTDANGNSVYNFIMKNPVQSSDSIDGKTQNLMGAVSQWTKKAPREGFTENQNYYFHPDKTQGIPMYGVQKFDPIDDWTPGTPFNISVSQKGQNNSYFGKTISLLRSLVKLELYIPRKLGDKDIIVENVKLCGSNVMARCEPLDVATPTERLWSRDVCDVGCEWRDLQNHKALIDNNTNSFTAAKGDNVNAADLLKVKKAFVEKLAWFYGAWQKWWDFKDPDVAGYKPAFGNDPYPHIYNPVVQRNTTGYLDNCQITDNPTDYHYIVYTGERNINDPTNFRDLTIASSKIIYFEFTIKYKENSSTSSGTTYGIAITDYEKNSIIKNYLGPTNFESKDGYLAEMAKSNNPDNMNYVLLRNHVYRYRIQGISGNLDENGFDGIVISSEQRAAPDIEYN